MQLLQFYFSIQLKSPPFYLYITRILVLSFRGFFFITFIIYDMAPYFQL